ncbi:MAG: hypothetical protein H5U05_09345 [Candidatus Aminicenantes bacterium]|nr:hypothetical protein [Candidatus Aminicenantes bacterium]
MSSVNNNKPDREIEAFRFLERDFNHCTEQLRHYDAQIIDMLKFTFTVYSALIGIAVGLYQFGLKENKNLYFPAIAALIVGLIIGLLMFALVVRNRAYFVQVVRYINEQRNFFLQIKPGGFENKSGMYIDYKMPPYFNWRSSHSWIGYILAAINASLLGGLLYLLFPKIWAGVIGGSSILFILQLILGIKYLRTRENKTTSKAIFGK